MEVEPTQEFMIADPGCATALRMQARSPKRIFGAFMASAIALMAVFVCSAAPLPARDAAPAADELGATHFPNSGAPNAQGDFLRGLLLLHSFEYELARKSFLAAEATDPGFAMAYWGEALTYNHPLWGEQDLAAARGALVRLAATPEERAAKTATARERDYLASVEKLYGDGDKVRRDADYSAALGALARAYPDDHDARALYALSILGLTGGRRNVANYMRAAAEAEAVYEVDRSHPGALHYLIHAYDDPIHAPLGLRAARLYGKLAPAASHAQHMPSHIFFALGMWDEAIAANVASLATARAHGDGGYHSLLWLVYAYLQEDRRREAEPQVSLAQLRARIEGARADAASATADSHGMVMADWHDMATADELGQARAMAAAIRGTIEYYRGDRAAGLAQVREAIAMTAHMDFEYGPPWSVKPLDELLGELLLTDGRREEAAAAFQKTLTAYPNRRLALEGLAASGTMR